MTLDCLVVQPKYAIELDKVGHDRTVFLDTVKTAQEGQALLLAARF